jgi:hypothetical protein
MSTNTRTCGNQISIMQTRDRPTALSVFGITGAANFPYARRVEIVIDLDAAALILRRHLEAWASAGCEATAITWRDAAAGWNAPFLTNRSSAADPDSVGVRLRWPNDREADIVLFRGGWADVDLFDGDAKVIVTESPEVATLDDYDRLLDAIPARLEALANR